MNPFKAGEGLTPWLLRIALLLFVYHHLLDRILQWSWSQPAFYSTLACAVLSVLLFVGGFLNKHKLTVWSALLLLLLALYQLFFVIFPQPGSIFSVYIFVVITAYYFWTKGNKA